MYIHIAWCQWCRPVSTRVDPQQARARTLNPPAPPMFSIDLASERETIDLEHIQESFIAGAEIDGNGLLKWIRSFHDLNSDALQTKLRAELASFKLPGDITRDRLLKTGQ